MEEQGVLFEDEVDDYHGTSIVPDMHWFKDMAAVGYAPPMVSKLKECGVQLMMETMATQLIMEDGKRMAMEVGGGEFMNPCWEGIRALENSYDIEPVGDSPIVWLFAMQGPGMWVNQNGVRFVREDVGIPNFDLPVTPVLAQRETYAVFNRTIAEQLLTEVGFDISAFDEYMQHAPDRSDSSLGFDKLP